MNKMPQRPVTDPTRKAAIEQLTAFIPEAGQPYTRLRNTDFGPDAHNAVSQLSPYIRHRLITELEVLRTVLTHHRFGDAEKFVHEVFWRCYFKGYLESRPEIWQNYVAARDDLISSLTTDRVLSSRYQLALTGQTGIDCFDAWVRELLETGYLHNHARMWFASIWIFTLKLPWQLGADFTLRHFLDGDPASNTLSWRWVAGLHTKGKIYLARASNIAEFTNGRFSPKGLTTEAQPLSEMPLERHAPYDPPPHIAASSEPALLLLTGEDLHTESLPDDAGNVRYIVGTQSASGRSSLPVSQAVLSFSDGALMDGLSRASSHFNAKYETIQTLTADGIMALARAHHLKKILTPHATIGPIADHLTTLRPKLAEQHFELVALVRREDRRIWPHAKKGFFELKQQIPRILEDLSITMK
jgi:deoxyribodipyrimidine photo-lyase